MILPNLLNSNEAYVFSRDEYALIGIRHGMFVMLRAATKINDACADPSDNYIVDGPKTIHAEWPSLRLAGFF